MKKAKTTIEGLTAPRNVAVLKTLNAEQMREFNELVDFWIESPEKIHFVGWEAVAREYGPGWNRPNLTGAVLKKNVEREAAARNGKKTNRKK